MSITASLDDFSLAEIFQLIEKGHKTGLLTVRTESLVNNSSVHYIWVDKGNLVAVASRLDQQGLVKLIEQRQWVSERVFDRLIHWCCPLSEPLGKYLKNQGILRIEQLKEIFDVQVLQPISALFHLKEGLVKFDSNVPMPTREMTGLSISIGIVNWLLIDDNSRHLN